ncbi:hypothetical protein O5551_10130 [Escherichia coli]|nr:hypothetical protein [Escherichia coli]
MIDSNAKLRSIQMPFCSSAVTAVTTLTGAFTMPASPPQARKKQKQHDQNAQQNAVPRAFL